MPGVSTASVRALHLAENPNDDFLLRQELEQQGFGATVELVRTRAELFRCAQQGAFDILIVDLPLVAGVQPETFDELAEQHPQLAVVFRWGDCGQRIAELPAEQLARRVREALHLRLDQPQDRAARERLIAEVVRFQTVQLELARENLWDFEHALRTITAAMARLLRVGRCSVWEFAEGGRVLRCLNLYDRAGDRHTVADPLGSYPLYIASLQRSLTLSANDAQNDPRTSELRVDYLEPLGVSAMLDAPIRRNGEVVGVLCHEHVDTEPRHWQLLEQCAAARAAGLVARAFEVRDRRRIELDAERLRRFEAAGAVARGVAHDLNNLLTVLGASLERLAATAPGDREALHGAQSATTRMTALVRDLATIGQARVLHRHAVDLNHWLATQASLLRAIVTPPTKFVLELGHGALVVDADPEALSRVLLNLTKNALESVAGAGTVTVRVQRRLAESRVAGRGECAALVVEDDGIGMDRGTVAQLFQPYFSRHGDAHGRGLGLATSLALVQQHSGTIEVESSPGAGARFRVLLPLRSAAGAAEAGANLA